MLVNSVKEHQLFPTSGFPTVLTAPLASFAMSLYILLMSLPRGPSLVGSVVDLPTLNKTSPPHVNWKFLLNEDKWPATITVWNSQFKEYNGIF